MSDDDLDGKVRCRNCREGRHENCEQLRRFIFGFMDEPCECDCILRLHGEERPEGACPNCGESAERHTWAGSTGPEPSDEWECPVPTPEKHRWVR